MVAVDESFEYPTPPSPNPSGIGSKHPVVQHRRAYLNANINNSIAVKGGNESQPVPPSSISVFKANRKIRADSVDTNSANLDIVNGEATLPYDVNIRPAGQVSPTKHDKAQCSSSSSSRVDASSIEQKDPIITHDLQSNAAPLLVKFGSIESSPVCLQLNSNGTGFVRWTKQGIYNCCQLNA